MRNIAGDIARLSLVQPLLYCDLFYPELHSLEISRELRVLT